MNPLIPLTGLLYIAVLLIEIRQWNICPQRRGEILGWIIFAAHSIGYSAAYVIISLTSQIPTVIFNYWSSSLRLHGVITLLTIVYARWRRSEKRHGC